MVTNSAPQKTWNSRKNHFKIRIQPKEMKNRLLVHHREMSFSRESSFTPLFHNSIKTRWLQNFIWIKNPVLPFFAFFQVDTLLKIGYSVVTSISSRVQQATQRVLSITDPHRYNSDTLPYFRNVFRVQFILDSRYVTEVPSRNFWGS